MSTFFLPRQTGMGELDPEWEYMSPYTGGGETNITQGFGIQILPSNERPHAKT